MITIIHWLMVHQMALFTIVFTSVTICNCLDDRLIASLTTSQDIFMTFLYTCLLHHHCLLFSQNFLLLMILFSYTYNKLISKKAPHSLLFSDFLADNFYTLFVDYFNEYSSFFSNLREQMIMKIEKFWKRNSNNGGWIKKNSLMMPPAVWYCLNIREKNRKR